MLQKKKTPLQKLFTHAQDEKDVGCSKNTLKCTFVFCSHYQLHYLLPDDSPVMAAHPNTVKYQKLWVVKGPEDNQIYIQLFIYIYTSTLH